MDVEKWITEKDSIKHIHSNEIGIFSIEFKNGEINTEHKARGNSFTTFLDLDKTDVKKIYNVMKKYYEILEDK